MNRKTLLYNQEEFQEFVVGQLKEMFPNMTFESDVFFHICAKYSNKKRITSIRLHNAWKNYERNGDINNILEYLEALVEAQLYINEEEKGFIYNRDKEILFPAVRNINRKEETKPNETEDSPLITKDLVGDIMLTYVMDYPKFTSALNKYMLLENLKSEKNKEKNNEELLQTKGYQFLEEMVQEQAIENLKKKGWIKPVQKKKMSFGTILKFVFDQYDYQYQFFMEEWTKRNLGTHFFLTFPNKHVTNVVIPKGGTESIKKIALTWLELETAETLKREPAHIISRQTYRYHAEEGWTQEKSIIH